MSTRDLCQSHKTSTNTRTNHPLIQECQRIRRTGLYILYRLLKQPSLHLAGEPPFQRHVILRIARGLLFRARVMAKQVVERFMSGSSGSGVSGALKLIGGATLLGIGISQSIYTVQGGHRGIIFSRIGGIQQTIFKEGLHFRVPWFQYPIIYDIRARPKRVQSPTGSKDLQMVNIGLRVLHRPDMTQLPTVYRNLGKDYDDRVLPSIMNEVLKSVVAQFNASQLITQRAKVSALVREQLLERAKDFNIILDDVSITDLSFGREYTAAVEAKQVAQQEAQRAQFLVEKAKQERQEKVVKAEGESKAATLLGVAMTENPGYLKLRKIRAAQQIAQTISNAQNRVYLNAEVLMLDLGNMNTESASKKK